MFGILDPRISTFKDSVYIFSYAANLRVPQKILQDPSSTCPPHLLHLDLICDDIIMFLKDWGPSKFFDLIQLDFSIFTVFDQFFHYNSFKDLVFSFCVVFPSSWKFACWTVNRTDNSPLAKETITQTAGSGRTRYKMCYHK